MALEGRRSMDGHQGLRVRGLSKVFPGTKALTDVDFDVRPGTIHALVGGNGSGKSTLIKILVGVHQGEPGGQIALGEDFAVDADAVTPSVVHAAGIRVVHQDLGIFPSMTVAENLALGGDFPVTARGRVRWRDLRSRTQEILRRYDIKAHPNTYMSELPPAAQTEVAIARALQDQDEGRPGLLILDEPTAALPGHQVERLHESLRRCAAGGQTIIYISHRLDEVLDLASEATVLRDGRVAGSFSTSELTEGSLFQLIAGREVLDSTPVRAASAPSTEGSPILQVENLKAGPLKGVDLTVRPGEIVGIAGLLGSGRTELLRAIFGDLSVESGRIVIDGDDVAFQHPGDAIAAGVAFVPESRKEAVFHDFPLDFNVAVASLSQYWRGLRLRLKEIRSDGQDSIAEFGVKARTANDLLSTLSGGNQQKVVLARWLTRRPKLLLLDEPTHGVDVGARDDLHQLVRRAAADGAGVVVVASDFEELAMLVDRAVVLRGGRVVAEATGDRVTAHALTELTYDQKETHHVA